MKIETAACRYGTMTYFADDEYVGKSLRHYGQFSDEEVDVMRKLLSPGDTVFDIGANVGAFTVPLAQMVGPTGRVIAFEPQPETCALLRRNVEQNNVSAAVRVVECAASDAAGSIAMPRLDSLNHKNYGGVALGEGEGSARTITVDSLNLPFVHLMKIDVEGHETEVVKGARETIMRCRPFIYIENDRPNKAGGLVSDIVDLGYRLYWHRPPLYSANNFRNEARNVFGGTISINMICVPEELHAKVDGCDEVCDLRMDEEMYVRERTRYERIFAQNPKDLGALLHVSHYNNLMQETDKAREQIEQILTADPNNIAAKMVGGLARIQSGDLDWASYELRYQQKNQFIFGGHRKPDLPQWDGTPTKERVLIWGEQGFGDSIMFCRFIKEALKRAPNLILEVQSQLYEVFEQSHIVPPGRLFRAKRTLPKCTMQCSIPSLLWALKVDEAMIRKHSKPYLKADKNLTREWLRGSPPSKGICRKGSPRSERPFTRDIDYALLEGVVERFGPFMALEQTGQFESYADTAAAIASLELVITVDTSVAHLSGALGVPTWLLMSFDPDWRWGLKSSECLWYPTMRIFRQPKLLDWKSVVSEIEVALERLQCRAPHKCNVSIT